MTKEAQARGLAFWLTRAVLAALAVLVLSLAGAAAYQAITNTIEGSALALPGKVIRTERRALYVHCMGEATQPTIMLENGMGVVSEEWSWVQRALAERYHVCAYDRAGTGHSPAVSGTVDATTASADLEALLDAMGLKSPVVLAGHSYGALVARVFAARRPDLVRALVLVDSSHEDMGERFPPQAQEGFRQLLDGFAQLRIMNVFGFARIFGMAEQMAKGLEGQDLERARHLYASVHHFAGAAAEAEGWERSASAARGIGSFGALPLTVIAVGGWPEFMLPSWLAMQNELAEKSTNRKFVFVKAADHFGIVHDRAFAQEVAREIDLLARNQE